MPVINIPNRETNEYFVGDGISSEYILSNIKPLYIKVYCSGLYMTLNKDYNITSNKIQFIEIPQQDENINIIYEY